jgi:NADH dehydrogenase
LHSKPKVVIIGAGFGGLRAAKHLNGQNCDVILIDKKNHHLFQPLLYQVALTALSPGDIAAPIRTELRHSKNIDVIYDEVLDIDQNNRIVSTKDDRFEFDYLVVAVGAVPTYFGNDDWKSIAPGLKTLNDALTIREKILRSVEKADSAETSEEYKRCLTFVIIGGGPTGVELAGSLSEITRRTILPDYKNIKEEDIDIILIDGNDRLLSTYPKELTDYTAKTLRELDVTLYLEEMVTDITAQTVTTNKRKIDTECVMWGAGNKGAGLLSKLTTEKNKAGLVNVNPDYSIPEDENIFVIGDAANLIDAEGKAVPGIAPAANQAGDYVADIIEKQIPRESREPFVYNDKGSMATIGRAKAVGIIGSSIKVKGFIAWMMWGLIHVFYLIDFRNRIKVMIEWFWFYITYKPGAQLILKVDDEYKQKKEA